MHLYCKDEKIEGDGLMSLLMPIIGRFVQNLLNKEILVPVYGMKVDVFFLDFENMPEKICRFRRLIYNFVI